MSKKENPSDNLIHEPELVEDENGLKLTDGVLELRGDLAGMAGRLRQANLERELLVRASRLKNFSGRPVLLDATAGLGEDSMLLAAAGFEVHMYENDPVIGALLEDAHRRALSDPAVSGIASRMTVHREDSIEAMHHLDYAPDVIFLDPMFPERQKSASVKKKFQLLQKLERPCSNEHELLEAAVDLRPLKIVIKRPVKGPFLDGRRPDYSITGNAVRYDCLVFARN